MNLDDDLLQAFVDGALNASERATVEAALAQDADANRRALRFMEQRRLLHEQFDPVLLEPVPERLHMRRPPWLDYARAASVLVVGVAIGLAMPYAWKGGRLATPEVASAPAVAPVPAALAMRAARAHLVYASEVRHPVEVDASQQDHLVAWLSKRLGTKLKVPVLGEEGFELLGGRLLPGPDGPVAQFMYQESSGKRLTLYVSARAKNEGQTAFRFAREDGVSVFYWIDGNWGYALSGEIDKSALSRVSTSVYRQLNP
ncbi:MAG TPA: anti-sigma factor [Usitatibacteraceae bacterium]|nr:anti-sigma factor [Usitatibacteraceae bacterium]